MFSPWLSVDVEMQMDERQAELNRRLQEQHVGVNIGGDIVIIDIAQSKAGDVYMLCINPRNPVHKFVTWGVGPNNLTHRWAGNYLFGLEEGIEDLNKRIGINKKVVRGPNT